MINKLTAWLCLLSLLCSLLTGCGGATLVETEALETIETTTVPPENESFYEKHGIKFWEGFEVHDTLDDEGNLNGGIFAEANISDSVECKVTMRSGGREEITYYLTDSKVEVLTNNYTLAEFDQACKEKNLSTENIKNPSDNLYKAFKKEDNSLTKEAWLEQYQDYRVIHGQFIRGSLTAQKVLEAKHAMNIGQSKWDANVSIHAECLALLDCTNGRIYESIITNDPGIAEIFSISTEAGTLKMGVVADMQVNWEKSGIAKDLYLQESFFVMVPDSYKDLAFVLPLAGMDRTLEAYDAYVDKTMENPWEEKTFAEYTEGYSYMKYYFLSPFQH